MCYNRRADFSIYGHKDICMKFQKSLLSLLIIGAFGIANAETATNHPNPQVAQNHRSDITTKVESDNALIKPAVAPLKKNNTPNRITSTIKGDPATSRAFTWFTSDKADNPIVRISTRPDMKNALLIGAETIPVTSHYIERDHKGYFIFKMVDRKTEQVYRYFTDEGKKAPWFPRDEAQNSNERPAVDIIKAEESSYKAHATGLTPNTTYYYQVGSGTNWSAVGQFKTAGKPTDEFTFIQYTDSQNAYYNEHVRNEAQFAADTLAQAQKIVPNAHFVLHTGDFVELAEAEDEWVDLMGQSQKGLLKMSLVPVAGNHDEFGIKSTDIFLSKFNNHFNIDSVGKIDGGSYYSFTHNNAHFVVLNTNDYKTDGKAIGKEQMDWLKADVQKAREKGVDWVILTYHRPLFSKGYHSLQDPEVQSVRDEFMKTIDELGVDLALQGHDHVYSRTKSLNYAPSDESFVNARIEDVKYSYNGVNIKTYHSPKGTIFMVPNTAGAKTYDIIYDRPLAHIHKIRPKLKWLTQPQLDHYNTLFEVGFQPQRSERFNENIGNYRDNSIQNFATYRINGKTLTAQVYQVSGDLAKGEKRTVVKVDEFVIEK